jgi:hypothetical protein
MAHSHSHAAGTKAASDYFNDQLSTIAVCGFLGIVGVMMFNTPMQEIILAPAFRLPVLIGGSVLLLIVLVRAISVWKLAGMTPPPEAPAEPHSHAHSHSHSHSHAHSHDEHSHDEKCDHPSHQECTIDHAHDGHDEEGHDDHDHGWAPWRYIILLVPAILFFLDLPNSGFSDERIGKDLGSAKIVVKPTVNYPVSSLVTSTLIYSQRSMVVRPIGSFNELNLMTLSPGARSSNQGSRVSLSGMYLQGTDREFDLFKLKRVCCGADALPLRARIASQKPIDKFPPRSWLKVTGELQFVKSSKGEWVAVIVVENPEDITLTDKETEFEDG